MNLKPILFMALPIYTKPHFPSEKAHFLLPGPTGVLEVYTHQPQSAQASTSIICHPHPLMGGTMHNKVITIIAQACHILDISTVRFNFRGVGNSEGEFDKGKGELEDLLAVIAWLKSVAQNHKITIVGFSFGSFIAASAEQYLDLQQLILIAPPVERFDFESLPAFRCPCSVIQGEEDVTVNPHAVLRWLNLQLPLAHQSWIPKADHFFHGQLLVLRDVLTQQLQIIQ